MRAASIARGSAGLGCAGVAILALDDVLRFAIASPLLGPTPAVIGASSVLLLLTAIALAWTRSRTVSCIAAALIVQVLGRVPAADDPAWWYWVVTTAQVVAPALAIVVGVIVACGVSSGARRLGIAGLIAAGCWLVASWLHVPLQLVPLTRTLTDLCLLFVIVWPALRRVRRGVRHLWDSAAVR